MDLFHSNTRREIKGKGPKARAEEVKDSSADCWDTENRFVGQPVSHHGGKREPSCLGC